MQMFTCTKSRRWENAEVRRRTAYKTRMKSAFGGGALLPLGAAEGVWVGAPDVEGEAETEGATRRGGDASIGGVTMVVIDASAVGIGAGAVSAADGAGNTGLADAMGAEGVGRAAAGEREPDF